MSGPRMLEWDGTHDGLDRLVEESDAIGPEGVAGVVVTPHFIRALLNEIKRLQAGAILRNMPPIFEEGCDCPTVRIDSGRFEKQHDLDRCTKSALERRRA